MPREKRYESRAEQQRAYRERKARGAGVGAGEDPVVFPPVVSEPSPLSEQQIRDRFDYTSSETRTKAERDAAAERMLRKAGLEARGITEESYVAEQLALTRVYVKMLKPLVRAPQDPPTVVDKTSPQAIEERLRRAEKHARWRYRGFVAGEVASL
jgi:hypothetical protein